MNHLQGIMADQIRLQKEAHQLATEVKSWELFFKAGKAKRLYAVELELLRTEQLIDAVIGLAYRANPFLNQAFEELISYPKVTKP